MPAQPPPALIGVPLEAVDTPALVIDLDAFERNLDRMAAWAATAGPNGAGVRLRPHAKTHKSPAIARMQIARGAVGVCCQKVAEAEILAAGGVDDVLISNEIVGAQKLARVAALARRITLTICVDDVRGVADLSAAAAQFGSEIAVLVEIDVGQGRCGVPPGAPAVRVAEAVAAAPRLRFAGLQAYHGAAQHYRTPAERAETIAAAAEMTRATVDALTAAGLSCEIIGGAGTGTFPIEGASGLWNELQPGSYIFLDADYARNTPDETAGVPRFEHALFVWTTVMSRAGGDAPRAIVDAGHKAAAVDSGPPQPFGRPGLVYDGPSDEHGRLTATPGAALPDLGERLPLIPGHVDPTVNLHDWFVGVRGFGTSDSHVEALWPIEARGAGF